MRIPVSLQLYTLRDALKTDPLGTLERVAQIGYTGIEVSLNESPEFLAKARELNLQITAAHVSLDALRGDLSAIIEKCAALPTPFAVLSWIAPNERDSAQKWRELGEFLDVVGAKLRANGVTLCYHNHEFEFEKFDGKTAIEILLEAASPSNLQAEFDTYWIQKGGADPTEFLRRYAGRTPLLHIKDMTPDGDFAPVGAGILDWPAIFSAAEKQGVTAYIVEQDKCDGDPFEAIALSLENLQKMGVV